MATKENVLKLMYYIAIEFPQFETHEEKQQLWYEHLAGYSPEQLKRGADYFLRTSRSPHPPSLPQLIAAIKDSQPMHTYTPQINYTKEKLTYPEKDTLKKIWEEARAMHPHLFRGKGSRGTDA